MQGRMMQKKDIVNIIIKSWFLLITLSAIAIFLPTFIDNRNLYIISALIIVVIKGQQIVDIFMELKTAPTRWRLIFLCYISLLPLVIAGIYLI